MSFVCLPYIFNTLNFFAFFILEFKTRYNIFGRNNYNEGDNDGNTNEGDINVFSAFFATV